MISEAHWYVVQTRVNSEQKAAANLERQGFGVYFPRYLKRRSHARKIETVPRPLFPRYIFVGIDLATQRWRAIQSTFGVSHLVCCEGKPAVVEGSAIDQLKAREGEDGFVKLMPRKAFSPGQKVRIVEGAFVDSCALVEGVGDNERVAVLLELLGRKVRALVGVDLIAAA